MMQLGFVETMRGELLHDGSRHPVEFTVTARGEGRGFFTLEGTAKAAPFADGPVSGSLRIHLVGLKRFIRYRLQLPGGFTLEGEKTPSPLKPIHSMTWMPVRLLNQQLATVAEGEMTFALRELPAFAFSWLPGAH